MTSGNPGTSTCCTLTRLRPRPALRRVVRQPAQAPHRHKTGRGARLVAVTRTAGIGFVVARTAPETGT